MATGIALIRGINVGGKNMVPLETLRGIAAEVGMEDAKTYIQSGNLIFRYAGGEKGLAKAAADFEKAMEVRVGFRPRVVVRTLEEMRGVVEGNPFAKKRGMEPNKLLVLFLADAPDGKAKGIGALATTGGEEVKAVGSGREVYIYFPDGAGKSKMSMAKVEMAAGGAGTARNWNTVERLVELAEELQ